MPWQLILIIAIIVILIVACFSEGKGPKYPYTDTIGDNQWDDEGFSYSDPRDGEQF